MKINTIILTLTLGGLSLATSELYGQERADMTSGEQHRSDSLQTMYRNEQVQSQKENDEDRLDNARVARRETKAKAKEARRVEAEANSAAKESKIALRQEKMAQRNRRQADAQAEKASKARDKADRN